MWHVRFRAMASDDWTAFKKQHMPKAKDADMTEFRTKIIAACAIEPPITEDQVKALRKKLGSAQIVKLSDTAFEACTAGGLDVPKSPNSWAQPRAAVARQQIETARSLRIAPTLYLEMRLPSVQYLYDDPQHPDRRTGAVHSPAWTHEDRALLMGLESYEASLCKCGVPIRVAWHSEMDGYYEIDQVVCHACSARAGRQVVYTHAAAATPAIPARPMPEFIPGKTITAPEKGP